MYFTIPPGCIPRSSTTRISTEWAFFSLDAQSLDEDRLQPIAEMNGWVSPRLKVRFEIEEVELQLYRPDGRRFATYAEIEARAERAIERASEERIRADRAETQAAIFASRLRELGVNPEELLARHRCAVLC